MGENTAIEWARHTFNAWIGCQEMSPACDLCYARVQNEYRHWVDGWGPHGERKRTSVTNWRKPLAWDKAAAALGERHTVFSNSLSDVFDKKVPAQWRKDLFDLIRATPNLIWLLLTKRPENIIKMSEAAGGLPPNAALGTTVEDQVRADHRLPHLRNAKGRLQPLFTFLSCEPLIGPLDLSLDLDHVDWVIAGGESGGKARPSHPDWARSLRDQCEAACVAFFFKQHGEFIGVPDLRRLPNGGGPGFGSYDHCAYDQKHEAVRVGKKRAGRMLDGVEHNGFPQHH